MCAGGRGGDSAGSGRTARCSTTGGRCRWSGTHHRRERVHITSLTADTSSFTVNWAPPQNTDGETITGYDVLWRQSGSSWVENAATRLLATARSHTVMGLGHQHHVCGEGARLLRVDHLLGLVRRRADHDGSIHDDDATWTAGTDHSRHPVVWFRTDRATGRTAGLQCLPAAWTRVPS